MRQVWDEQEIRPSQHGFVKGSSCLTNLISFYDPVTHLMDEGKKERLLMCSTWTSAKPSQLSPMLFSYKSWQPFSNLENSVIL